MDQEKEVELNNGIIMPLVGFGVFQIKKEETTQAVLDAIKIGYRLIDTAQSYLNEVEVGAAIAQTSVPREELFVTTKIWIDNFGYEKTKRSLDQSLRNLQVDYIDLVLLHQPLNDVYGAYRALEEYYQAGKLKAIGLSNFEPDRLADMVAFNEITPQVNQVETNPYHQQVEAQENMLKRNVQIQAWAPFGEGQSDLFTHPVLKTIGDKYQKSIPQVILRWLVQRKVSVLSKSTHIERMRENFDIFDFQLTTEDMARIAALDKKESIFFDFQKPETVDMFVKLVEERRGLIK